MKLKSFGCSFIYGDELPDTTFTTPSSLTWPALLAGHLNYDYECHAKNGIGNLEILDRLLTQLSNNDSALYVINWTWPQRYDYKQGNNWSTVQPMHNSTESKLYFKYFDHEYVNKLRLLMCMSTAITALNQANAKYVMTYMDNGHIEPTENEPGLLPLYNIVNPHLFAWDNNGFNHWCEYNKFEKCPGKHWAESTQKIAFEYIANQFYQKG